MTVVKDPDAELDYSIDWSLWLATGETISASVWTVPAGITESTDSNQVKDPAIPGGTSTVIWLHGGTAGEDYEIANKITTSAYRVDERTICVKVRER